MSPNHTNYDDAKESDSAPPNSTAAHHPLPSPPPTQQEMNKVTPAAITPADSSINVENASSETENSNHISPATKQLFASTPRYPTTNIAFVSIAAPHSQKLPCRKRQVHKSILSKGLLPLDHNRNEKFRGFEDSSILAPRRKDVGYSTPGCYEDGAADAGRVEEKSEEGDHVDDDDDDGGGVVGRYYESSYISAAAVTAANTAAQISGGSIPYTIERGSGYTTSEGSSSRSGNNFHTVTSPRHMAEIKSLSSQARAQIAQMKRNARQQQQVESQRVADIAHADVVFNERYSSTTNDDNNASDVSSGEGIAVADLTTKVKKVTQKRYKDKDGFIYYRRVGNKHYKKLFEKGLVPKGDDGDSADAKVVERVNAIQTITTTIEDGLRTVESHDVEVPVIHQPKTDERVVEDDGETLSRLGIDRPVEEEEEDVSSVRQDSDEQEPSLHLPPPPFRQTQLLYSHQQKKPISSIDGYELRVVPNEDGNDFLVELVQPAAVMMEHTQQWQDSEKVESEKNASTDEKDVLPSSESEKSGDKDVEVAATVGSKGNAVEFFSAVDSILDAGAPYDVSCVCVCIRVLICLVHTGPHTHFTPTFVHFS